MNHIMVRDAGKPDFNEEELKLFGSDERKVKDSVIVMIKDIDSLKRNGLNDKIFFFPCLLCGNAYDLKLFADFLGLCRWYEITYIAEFTIKIHYC